MKEYCDDLTCECCGVAGPNVYETNDGDILCPLCARGDCYCDMEYGDPWGDSKESYL